MDLDSLNFHDGNIYNSLYTRHLHVRHDTNQNLQMHSSLIRRITQEKELEGHHGCVNTIAWNSNGSLLISGSDDAQINIWNYSDYKLRQSVETGHSSNIFCTKFIPETSDELVVSGAGDCEVRLFNLSRLKGRGPEGNDIDPLAHFRCHEGRVKKLAVEAGNPNVVWSASEDGTLRQHDFREVVSCPPPEFSHQDCRNVLLDLRCGAKRSLADPPKRCLPLKSCDISSTRPHLLLVGGSDAFARLYDRRMLPPLSSCQYKRTPPLCVNYFCPMHLSYSGQSRLNLTHVTFSPNGEEVLLNYSGEHVYLMDVNRADGCPMQYAPGDVSKLMTLTPAGLNDVQPVFPNGLNVKRNVAASLDKCRKLLHIAEKSLIEGAYYFDGINACNEVVDGHGREIGSDLMHEALCIRAALLLKRKWKNDAHMSIRDCNKARRIDNSFRASYLMSEALLLLGKHEDALDFAVAARSVDPSNSAVAEMVENIKSRIVEDENSKANSVASKSKPLSGGALSLSDILHRLETNSDASQDGPRSEREDADYEDELELDLETSISGDDEHDVESNILHGSLNLRIHHRSGSFIENSCANGSCGSPTSSQNDRTTYQPEAAIDMKQRYVGHCNVGTDIKHASFLGQKGDYVACGSDDGRWFIWEKKTGRLIKVLLGDGAVVNCVQCHPYDCVVATSGIDSTIKIWTPSASVPSILECTATSPEPADVLHVMERNQGTLCRNRETILPFELLEQLRMQEFTEGSLHHPFECAQS